jgi:hypothetical protein
MRGRHVHEQDFAPPVLERVAMIETLTSSRKGTIWLPFYAKAIKSAKTEWINHCAAAKVSATLLVASAFKLTKPVWSKMLATH